MNAKKRILSGVFWKFLERFGAQLVTLIVSIVLARVLDPIVYGSIAIITSITTILQVFTDAGLASALIQKKDADDLDFSTVFVFNLIFSFLLYLVLFFTAGLIADFYEIAELKSLIRVLSISLIISAFKNILHAYISRNMEFKKFFFATIVGTVISGVLGIILAINNFGAWSLVAQILSNLSIDTLILFFVVRWKPSLKFSATRFKTLFKFGSMIFFSKLLSAFSEEFRTLCVGKAFSTDDLAFYNKGLQFPAMVEGNAVNAIDTVLFPAMSKEQNDCEAIKKIARMSISVSTFVIYPILFGLFSVSDVLIPLLLTDKWNFSIKFLKIFCLMYLSFPMITANWNIVKSIGKSKTHFILESIRLGLGLILLMLTIRLSTFYVAVGYLISNWLILIPIFIVNKRYINYSYKEQLLDFLPNFLLSLFMCIVVVLFSLVNISLIVKLILEVFIGVVCYFLVAYLIKNKTFFYLLNLFKNRKN